MKSIHVLLYYVFLLDNRYILQLLHFVRRNCVQLMDPGEMHLVMTTLEIFEMIMTDAVDENRDDFLKHIINWTKPCLLYSLYWGVGGILDRESREKFDEFSRKVKFDLSFIRVESKRDSFKLICLSFGSPSNCDRRMRA